MQPRRANHATTVALAIAAALTLGFAPAVDSGAQSEPEPSSQGGKCLEGYAYVDVLGNDHGITSTWCVKSTNCTSTTGAGPGHHSLGPATAYHYVQVPVPSGIDVTCYV